MPKAYSLDLRERVAGFVDSGRYGEGIGRRTVGNRPRATRMRGLL